MKDNVNDTAVADYGDERGNAESGDIWFGKSKIPIDGLTPTQIGELQLLATQFNLEQRKHDILVRDAEGKASPLNKGSMLLFGAAALAITGLAVFADYAVFDLFWTSVLQNQFGELTASKAAEVTALSLQSIFAIGGLHTVLSRSKSKLVMTLAILATIGGLIATFGIGFGLGGTVVGDNAQGVATSTNTTNNFTNGLGIKGPETPQATASSVLEEKANSSGTVGKWIYFGLTMLAPHFGIYLPVVTGGIMLLVPIVGALFLHKGTNYLRKGLGIAKYSHEDEKSLNAYSKKQTKIWRQAQAVLNGEDTSSLRSRLGLGGGRRSAPQRPPVQSPPDLHVVPNAA